MSSVTSHSETVVGEHLLLGIQMWLMYRLSYSLAKERKAQCHTSFFHPASTMVASDCLIHLLFMGQQNKHLLQTPVPSHSSLTNQPFFLTPFMTKTKEKLGTNPNVSRSLHLHGSPPQLQPLSSFALLWSPN